MTTHCLFLLYAAIAGPARAARDSIWRVLYTKNTAHLHNLATLACWDTPSCFYTHTVWHTAVWYNGSCLVHQQNYKISLCAYGDGQQPRWTHFFTLHVWRSCITLCGNIAACRIKSSSDTLMWCVKGRCGKISCHPPASPVQTQRGTWPLALSSVLMFVLYSLSLCGTLFQIMEEKVYLPFNNVFLWHKELHCALNK